MFANHYIYINNGNGGGEPEEDGVRKDGGVVELSGGDERDEERVELSQGGGEVEGVI